MNALVLWVALATGQTAGPVETPAGDKAVSKDTADKGVQWLDDYGAALKQARQEGKPLLIVIDRPADAVGRITQISHTQAGETAPKPADDLKNYVLCRVDADSVYGKAVAKAFEASTLPHTSVIDKKAEYILFSKAGQFSAQEWTSTLDTYRSGVQPVSFRASTLEQAAYGSSYCPSCQRGR